MGLAEAVRAIHRAPRVKRSRNPQREFIAGTHKKRKISEWTGADIAAFRRQLADWQGWEPGSMNPRRDNALGRRLIELEGGPAGAARLVLAACYGEDFGLDFPRDLSWLVGGGYKQDVKGLMPVLAASAAKELPGVTAAIEQAQELQESRSEEGKAR